MCIDSAQKFALIALLVLACMTTGARTAEAEAVFPASPIQWTGPGANDHWYQIFYPVDEVEYATTLSWSQARDGAASLEYLGTPGLLVTITSSGEQDFITNELLDNVPLDPNGLRNGHFWFGGFVSGDVPQWITGEPFDYTNWQTGNPSGLDGVLEIGTDLGAYAEWNIRPDAANPFTRGYIVEWDIPVSMPDEDGDGIPDEEDECLGSNLSETIVIDGCDTGVLNQLLEDGCSLADLVSDCSNGAGNHGAFVSCVADLTNGWKNSDLITGQQKGRIQSCAAQSNMWMPCQTDVDCDDGVFCNGVEVCLDGGCVVGDPCPGQGCDEQAQECVE